MPEVETLVFQKIQNFVNTPHFLFIILIQFLLKSRRRFHLNPKNDL